MTSGGGSSPRHDAHKKDFQRQLVGVILRARCGGENVSCAEIKHRISVGPSVATAFNALNIIEAEGASRADLHEGGRHH